MPLLLLLAGCTETGSATVLSGFAFEWQAFNHRLSLLSFGSDSSGGVEAAVVGGTSTTGVVPTYADECDPDTCKEFPLTDTAALTAMQTTVTADGLHTATGSVTLVVGSQGDSETVELQWEQPPDEVTPVIAGFTVDTRQALDACYDPGRGWLPRRLALSVSAVGTVVTATASFAAGLSLEEARACLDAAAPDARVTVTVQVLALSGVETGVTPIQRSGAYDLGSAVDPEPQEPPAPVLITDGFAWQSLDWTFHNNDADGRGAYLRSLTFFAGEQSSVSASNYSPGTQLSAFDFAFSGNVVSVAGAREVDKLSVNYTPSLDIDGDVTQVVVQ